MVGTGARGERKKNLTVNAIVIQTRRIRKSPERRRPARLQGVGGEQRIHAGVDRMGHFFHGRKLLVEVRNDGCDSGGRVVLEFEQSKFTLKSPSISQIVLICDREPLPISSATHGTRNATKSRSHPITTDANLLPPLRQPNHTQRSEVPPHPDRNRRDATMDSRKLI